MSKYTLGVVLIVTVAIIWVSSSAWIQYIFDEMNFSKPYFLTYFNTSGFCLWNLGYLMPAWRAVPWDEPPSTEGGGSADHSTVHTEEVQFNVQQTGEPCLTADEGTARIALAPAEEYLPADTPTPTGADRAEYMELRSTSSSGDTDHRASTSATAEPHSTQALAGLRGVDVNEEAGPRSLPGAVNYEESFVLGSGSAAARSRIQPYGRWRIYRAAATFCPLWFLANYLFNVSLSITSVASNTILSTTSSIWTLALSYLILGQDVTALKALAVVLSISGTVCIALSDRNAESDDDRLDTVAGDFATLISAFFYASYSTVLKKMLPEDERYHMGMVFGAVGAINLVFLAPGLLVVHSLGVEPFQLPTWKQLWPLGVNSLIGTNLSDVLWARSVVLTSPVVATLGLSLTMPLAMVLDAVLKGSRYSAVYVLGALIIAVGFVVANVPGGR